MRSRSRPIVDPRRLDRLRSTASLSNHLLLGMPRQDLLETFRMSAAPCMADLVLLDFRQAHDGARVEPERRLARLGHAKTLRRRREPSFISAGPSVRAAARTTTSAAPHDGGRPAHERMNSRVSLLRRASPLRRWARRDRCPRGLSRREGSRCHRRAGPETETR